MGLGVQDAYRLLHEGSVAFAKVETNGIRVNMPYLNRTIVEIDEHIRSVTEELYGDEIWYAWKDRYGRNANLTSGPQLAEVLFEELDYPCTEFTDTGKPKVDESVLEKFDSPFFVNYLLMKRLKKVKTTYLGGIVRETVDGFLHPSYNLATGGDGDRGGGARSYRSSSSMINFQNIPIRDPVTGEMIRRCFISRNRKWHIAELDFSQLEVRVSHFYNKDPVLEAYIRDPSTCMHRDTAAELFHLPLELLKEHKDWAKKGVRDWAKNRFVFPSFYGSVYFQCAPHLWEAVILKDEKGELRHKLPDGTPLLKHLEKHGIKALGKCDPKEKPVKGTFEARVKEVEDSFWNKRFKVYTQWKKTWWEKYQSRGYFDMLTGFRCSGYYKRNDVINYPVQGTAFHCLLWCLIRLQNEMARLKMKSVIIGQIHDCILADVHPKELQDFLSLARRIMTVDLLKEWRWISVPLETESEVCPAEGSWYDKKQWIDTNGIWSVKA